MSTYTKNCFEFKGEGGLVGVQRLMQMIGYLFADIVVDIGYGHPARILVRELDVIEFLRGRLLFRFLRLRGFDKA